ncbi:MAG: hypothetical protein KF734_04460 [Saprospiraceae bacterium]|nr:hypothetical protein [Saprospiraceae bacterium]
MKHHKSLSETIQNLTSKGYQLADTHIDTSIHSEDWRLDSVEKIHHNKGNALVIAVSSVQRCLKLVFVEVIFSPRDFSPMTLLRRLFPMRQKETLPYAPAYLN